MSTNTTNRLFETNNYSIVSKYSAIKKGYFSDPLLTEFIEKHLNIKTWRRTPIVNRGYAARLLAMDWIISRSIVSEALDCLIVLGAGFDTLPLRYSQCCWIEIDLPQVVEAKLKFLNDNKLFDKSSLVEVDIGVYSSVSQNYHLISCDLQDSSRLTSCLNRVIHVQNDSRRRNYALVNEVCLCYLEMGQVANILQVVISTIQEHALRVHYIGYEQLKPKQKSQFSDVMLNHFESLGHPLKYFPTASQIKQLFSARLKFNHITVISMYQLYHNALLANRLEARGFHEEPFDEYEEMDLYLSHYALVTGVLILSDPFIDWYDNPKIFNSPSENELSSKLVGCSLDQDSCQTTLIPSEIQRFGHATCILKDDVAMKSFIIMGGFGTSRRPAEATRDKHQHKRLDDCLIVSMNGSIDPPKTFELSMDSDEIRLDRMHGQVGQVSQNLLFLNGGRQSPVESKTVNRTFIGEIDVNQLKVKHLFDSEKVRETLCWRHRLSTIVQDKMFQVGGLSTGLRHPLIEWNLSSSRLGYTPILSNESDMESLDRHSFGIDMRDDNTLLVFGGLKARGFVKDRPVDCQSAVVLWDFRSNTSTRFDLGLEGCYNAGVHFISDNQFVRIGGVSCKTGAEAPLIETIDLRGSRTLTVPGTIDSLLPNHSDFVMLTNSTSNHFKSDKTVVTAGGGGNYFTFGTQFTRSHLVYKYGL